MKKFMICKYCASTIDRNSKTCPECNKEFPIFKYFKRAILIIGACAFIVFVAVGTESFYDIMRYDFIEKSNDEFEYIGYNKYSKIKEGMSYDKVEKIIGQINDSAVHANTPRLKL